MVFFQWKIEQNPLGDNISNCLIGRDHLKADRILGKSGISDALQFAWDFVSIEFDKVKSG